jgi:hypothetical protein
MRLPDQTECDELFQELDKLVKDRSFNTSTGQIRNDLRADEFMLMQVNGVKGQERETVAFKHRDTRNYLYMSRHNGQWMLTVPQTQEAFKLGFFDKTEIPQGLV